MDDLPIEELWRRFYAAKVCAEDTSGMLTTDDILDAHNEQIRLMAKLAEDHERRQQTVADAAKRAINSLSESGGKAAYNDLQRVSAEFTAHMTRMVEMCKPRRQTPPDDIKALFESLDL